MADGGSLKIFLGMAAGVGKTYRMLQEGRAAADDGRDVVVGVLETHGRAETAAQAEGLDVVPRRTVDYRGHTAQEMDLPGIVERAPELCLVDELAHSNPPGVEHGKRYEDIADLLEAGIDVYSTVNVQHLESLNDQVFELTGVRVRETFPDRLLAEADEVVLVDITPEALMARLREGRVYPRARVQTALENFFRVENLQALREVALRQVAEEVEAKRLVREDPLAVREERLFGSVEPKAFAERLLALASLDGGSERVVRRAWRSAQRLHADMDILVVRPPGEEASAQGRAELEALRRLASVLGAQLIVDEGDDPAAVIARVARERGSTYAFMGPPGMRRGLGRLSEPLPMRLLRMAPQLDVRIVADRGAAESARAREA
jgi:two-component system, OmpR family, sensor histidine kinase KdpD